VKRTSVTLALSFVFVMAASSQSSKPTKLESELREVLRQRWAALGRHDAGAYGAFLDDAILMPDNGSIYDKKKLVERARTVGEYSDEPRDVHVYGDDHSAVMIYRTTSHVPLAGQTITEELTITESYLKHKGQWLLAARAENEIPNENRAPAKIDSNVLDAYVGEYEISPGKIIRITRDGDKLMEQGPDDPNPEADLPLSENIFFQREQPGVLTFTRSTDGKVDAYVLWIYDSTVTGKKIR
jgi:hypothetical protein